VYNGPFPASFVVETTTAATGQLPYSRKRTVPSLSFSLANTFTLLGTGGWGGNPTAVGSTAVGSQGAVLPCTVSGATVGPAFLRRDGTDAAFITIDAEL
jgi:hypothetical protein